MIQPIDIIAKYGFDNATEVLMAGGSAGALGVTSNIDWLNNVHVLKILSWS